MTATNFVFLLAVVTLGFGIGYGTWQLRRARKAKRNSDRNADDRAVGQRS